MWKCKLCHVSFAFESVEQHVYSNHIKPNVGSIKVYSCGECMFTAEGFEDIAIHCIDLEHEPTRVDKGQDYDDYESQLFTALEETMCLNKSSAMLNTFASTFLATPSEPVTPTTCTDINWSDPTSGSDYKLNNISQALLADDNIEFRSGLGMEEDGYTQEVKKIKLAEPEAVQATKLTTPNPKPVEQRRSEFGTRRVRLEGSSSKNTPSPAIPMRPPTSPVVSDVGTKKKTYPCSHCPKMYVTSSAVKLHERNHTGNKPFQCPTCGKGFGRKFILQTHERTHSGEKPFTCPVCERSFARKHKLEVHGRTHSGEKPFACNVCTKSFAYTNSLAIHKRTHSGEKPFPCSVCDKSFRAAHHLKVHEATHDRLR